MARRQGQRACPARCQSHPLSLSGTRPTGEFPLWGDWVKAEVTLFEADGNPAPGRNPGRSRDASGETVRNPDQLADSRFALRHIPLRRSRGESRILDWRQHTMTTQDTNPTFAINTAANNSYPYVTKKQVAERLADDPDFRVQCLLVLYRRQTEDERDAKDTRWKNKRGFMSSHAVNGSKLAEKVITGEDLTEEEHGKLEAIVGRYTKQLAAHYRAEQTASLDAEAAAQIREKFGV